jgi:hypothetical protein
MNIEECVPYKIQNPDASGFGGLEGEDTACVSDENPWTNVPNLNFNRDNRKIKLNYDWYDNHNSHWAVPSFVRDSLSQIARSYDWGSCFRRLQSGNFR